jgi:hypothetical protein
MHAVQLLATHANAAMKEETLLETKTALLGNQPGIVATVSMEPGCG